MFEKTLPKKTYDLVKSLKKLDFLKKFYLAGETALTLQFGHRKSIDLDFFTEEDFDQEEIFSQINSKSKSVKKHFNLKKHYILMLTE